MGTKIQGEIERLNGKDYDAIITEDLVSVHIYYEMRRLHRDDYEIIFEGMLKSNGVLEENLTTTRLLFEDFMDSYI